MYSEPQGKKITINIYTQPYDWFPKQRARKNSKT